MKILFAGFVGGAMRVSENGNLLVITLYDRSDNQKRTGTASKNHPTRVVTHECSRPMQNIQQRRVGAGKLGRWVGDIGVHNRRL
jgi:hypothetical protein